MRKLFYGDKNVAVSEGEGARVEVVIGNPSRKILKTSISHINFSIIEQYNAYKAISSIIRTPDVMQASRSLGTYSTVRVTNDLLVQPGPGLVHVSSSLGGVTMDEALDKLAGAFKGIVFFGICPDNRLYQVDIFAIDYKVDGNVPPEHISDSEIR